MSILQVEVPQVVIDKLEEYAMLKGVNLKAVTLKALRDFITRDVVAAGLGANPELYNFLYPDPHRPAWLETQLKPSTRK